MEGANEECVGPASEQAGKASSCEGCPNQSACASGANRGPDPGLFVFPILFVHMYVLFAWLTHNQNIFLHIKYKIIP